MFSMSLLLYSLYLQLHTFTCTSHVHVHVHVYVHVHVQMSCGLLLNIAHVVDLVHEGANVWFIILIRSRERSSPLHTMISLGIFALTTGYHGKPHSSCVTVEVRLNYN